MTPVYIFLACLAGSILSVTLAAWVAWRVQPRLIPLFVSYAIGALLGVVFLELLPHIFQRAQSQPFVATWILAGILGFFVLEKMVLWRHNHDHAGAAEQVIHHHHHHHASPHVDHHAASAWMIIIGDGFHNFTDGMAIAAAFLADTKLGVVTSLAIIAHELPQELGDFLVLMHSGFSKMRALMWNLVSSLATLLGAALAYVALNVLQDFATVFLCFAASSMIYVAIADLMPGLHRRSKLIDTFQQVVLILLGVGSIALVHALVAD
ncbi:MAG: ZIP family metal transporter [Betaproteobacteria bacterium]|nr:ZIP family metal transporter [Betaproteobacteria bacterium]